MNERKMSSMIVFLKHEKMEKTQYKPQIDLKEMPVMCALPKHLSQGLHLRFNLFNLKYLYIRYFKYFF